MFQTSSVYYRSIALSMPLVILLAWITCVSICTDNTTNYGDPNASSDALFAGETDYAAAPDDSGECPLAAPTALQERPFVINSALIEQNIGVPHSQIFLTTSSVAQSDVNQNSPPQSTNIPLFLALCNFRI